MNLLHRLAVEEQKAILLSTHDIEQALILADRLWLLTREGGLECGVTEDLILHNRMDSLFPRNKNIRFYSCTEVILHRERTKVRLPAGG